jgi:hypothetical protein
MAKTISVVKKNHKNIDVKVGSETLKLLARFKHLDKAAKDTLVDEARYLLSNAIPPSSANGSVTGIAIGYVQSGKTMSFTTLTTIAIDNGFRIIIYFAGVKNNLLEQTIERLEKDLQTSHDFQLNLIENPSVKNEDHKKIAKYLKNTRNPVTLIVILKHHTHLKTLTEIFESPEIRGTLVNNGVLIIDDEADQASLDSNARTNSLKRERANRSKTSKKPDFGDLQTSKTYACILKLKDSIPNHTYIQYTATPQGPLLINVVDILSPKFHKILTPGNTYTGGKTFFGEGTKESPVNPNNLIITIPRDEVFNSRENVLTSIPDSLVDALQIYLIGVAININILNKLEPGEPLSMMIHADKETDASDLFAGWVNDTLGTVNDGWDQTLKKHDKDPGKIRLMTLFKKNYAEATKNLNRPPSFDRVMSEISNVLDSTNIQVITGKYKKGDKTITRKKEELKVKWGNHPSHIIIGAEMLNRGFTIEGLMVSYMPRYSKGKSQADTIEQRCRFFGYKAKYLDSCRVFLPKDSIKEYVEYVKHEEIFRHHLKKDSLRSYEQTMVLHPGINPSRSGILQPEIVKSKLSGYHQLNALQSIQENILFIETFLKKTKFVEYKKYKSDYQNHRYAKIKIEKFIEFLLDFKLGNYPDTMRKAATIQYLKYQAEVNKLNHAYIFEMGYKSPKPRERYLELFEESVELNNIFSGGDTEAERKKDPKNDYKGDRFVKFDDSICIQIHKIIPTLDRLTQKDRNLWASKIGNQKYIYTIAIYYPEAMAIGFTGIKS